MRWSLVMACVLTIVVSTRSQAMEETCLSGDEEPYLHFGPKTAYTFSLRTQLATKVHEVPNCKPVALYLLSRTGTHNPESAELGGLQELVNLRDNIVANYRNGNFRNTGHRFCAADLNLLEQWQWSPRQNMTFAGDLTSEGYMSTQLLAKAWRQKFPELLNDNRLEYLFKYANEPRSITSFSAFTEGIFNSNAENFDIPKQVDDSYLKPYKSCPEWYKQVGDNNETIAQRAIFESKLEYREMITNVSKRLGFNYDINKQQVLRIYQMCRYNKAWNVDKISPWCAAFTKEDLQRLEYAEDVEYYYRFGYGSSINQKVGCTNVKDFMDFFDKHAETDSSSHPHSVIHITSFDTLLLMLSSMGAVRDAAPLTGDNYHSKVAQARRWTTSNLTPYNANLAAVLYKCDPNVKSQIAERFQVLFLLNEQPLNLENCRYGLCDWSYVKRKFGEIAQNCNLGFCTGGATQVNPAIALYVTVTAALVRYLAF